MDNEAKFNEYEVYSQIKSQQAKRVDIVSHSAIIAIYIAYIGGLR